MAEENTQAQETRAKEVGWIPKEQFKGDPERWTDAATFLRNADTVLPILKKKNAALETQVANLTADQQRLNAALQESQTAIQSMMAYQSEETKRQVKLAKDGLRAQLVTARKDGDTATEIRVEEEMDVLRTAELEQKRRDDEAKAEADRRKAGGNNGTDNTQQPWFVQWQVENEWYGKDARRTALANGIANEMRAGGDKRVGKLFLDDVAAEVDKTMGGGAPAAGDKVEGGGRHGNKGGGSGKTYNDLPAEAKAACAKYDKSLVGANKSFKTVEDWRKHYATKYFEEA